jgi:hypothetical protein
VISNLTVKVGANIDDLRKDLNSATSQLKGFSKSVSGVGGLIAGAFTGAAIFTMGKAIFNATAQFEKFNAVLTNTFQDAAVAKLVMDDIQEFAAKTPFQVEELTASFVKLANQGFVPTIDQLRQLGDLAAAQGKSFDQLTEAIIDAQTGEFERLKEFGIRASKSGDQVKFTFKGVETQVKFTNESIRQYILSLGDAAGVSGGMAAQSETLGGGLSNLMDAFDQLAVSIGKSANNGGFLSWILDGVAKGVKGLNEVFKGPEIVDYYEITKDLLEARKQAALAGDIERWGELNDVIQHGTEKMREWWLAQKKLEEIRASGVAPNGAKTAVKKATEAELTKAQRLRYGLEKGREFEKRDVGGVDTKPLTKAAVDMEAIQLRMNAASVGIQESFYAVPQAVIDIAPVLSQGLADMATTLGEGIGNILAGAGSLSDLGPLMLGALGGVMIQLGQMAIQAGIGIEAIKTALKSLNPYVAIAAGVALVALGVAVRGRANKIGKNMGKGGGGGGGGASPSSSSTRGMTEAQDSKGVISETQIRGKDLWVVLQNYEKDSRATKMMG